MKKLGRGCGSNCDGRNCGLSEDAVAGIVTSGEGGGRSSSSGGGGRGGGGRGGGNGGGVVVVVVGVVIGVVGIGRCGAPVPCHPHIFSQRDDERF